MEQGPQAFSKLPLENNTAEKALKARILERKNSYFYKTEVGARVGDIISSLIQSALKAKINPFHYLTYIHRNREEVRKNPEKFLPWFVREKNLLCHAALS